MTPRDLHALEEIRTTQRILQRELAALERKLDALTERLEAEQPPPLPVPFAEPAVAPTVFAETPDAAEKESVPAEQESPPPAPLEAIPAPEYAFVAPIPRAPVPAGPSFEFKLGAFWLVRIGVVILLTGLVFLGNYAYQHFISQVGPGVKIALLSLAGGTLLGAGFWLERGVERMRNFARVLIAGGMAALYYTTYAAHFVGRLRVIESPLVGGAALLALAGGIAWFADRRRSQSIALLAVLLSYYTAAINPVASFSLFSNLLLTALALWFLIRHRWAQLSFLSIAATYASFAYWRFYQTGDVFGVVHLGRADFWPQSLFLLSYWLLFTTAVFVSRGTALSATQRTPFLTTNNAAFFGLTAPMLTSGYPVSFGAFCLVFGAVLLALSIAARKVRADDPFMDGAYLAQGLALITVGLIAHFTGYQLALALAVESAVLLEMSRFRHGRLYQVAAALTALGATGFAFERFPQAHAQIVPLGSALAGIFTAMAWRFKQSRGQLAEPRFHWRPAGLILLALALFAPVIGRLVGDSHFAPGFAAIALAGALTLPLLRLPELALLSQGYWIFAHLTWAEALRDQAAPPWHALVLLGTGLATLHWWQWQRIAPGLKPQILMLPYAVGIVEVLNAWLPTVLSPMHWMVTAAGLAAGLLAYGLLTKAWWLAVFSQRLLAVSIWLFAARLVGEVRPLEFAWSDLAVLALLGGHVAIGKLTHSRQPAELQKKVDLLASFYAGILSVLGFLWCLAVLPPAAHFNSLTAIAFALFLAAVWRRNPELMLHAAGFAAGAFIEVWHRKFVFGTVFVGDLFGVLLLLLVQQLARRRALSPSLFPDLAHPALILSGLGSLWLGVSHFASRSDGATLLTVAWSVLAFLILGVGFFLGERLYRQVALGLLGLTVIRVFTIDVWKFETLYRIASFVVLGVVLIVISYLYNRFSPRGEKPEVLPPDPVDPPA